MLRLMQATILVFALNLMAPCPAQEQYPPPLQHTPANHPAQRVILLSVDGLHALDLARWVASEPESTLAALSRRGVTYTNAHLPWDDPAVGMLALATGGTPLSTGIFSSTFYDRALSPAGSRCATRGVAVDLLALPDSVLNASDTSNDLLPRDPANGCKPIAPHQMAGVGNVFELVHARGGITAWAGDRPALVDLYRGPSGLGLTEAISISATGDGATAASIADDRRLAVLLHWIRGEDSAGHEHPGVPELFGMNFTAFAEAQRSPDAGYVDMLGDPSAAMTSQLRRIDASIGRIVDELRKEHLFDSTWIIVTATYTQSPMARKDLRYISRQVLQTVLNHDFQGEPAYISSEGAPMVWLHHPESADRVARALAAKSETLGIGEIDTHERLKLFLEPEQAGPRSPDMVLLPQRNVIWSSGGKRVVAIRAGRGDDDTHVALLVSGAQLTGRSDPTPIPTSQTPALLLRALGMEKLDLPALHREHSPALPGIF